MEWIQQLLQDNTVLVLIIGAVLVLFGDKLPTWLKDLLKNLLPKSGGVESEEHDPRKGFDAYLTYRDCLVDCGAPDDVVELLDGSTKYLVSHHKVEK